MRICRKTKHVCPMITFSKEKIKHMPFNFPLEKAMFLMQVDSTIQEGVCKCQQSPRLLGNALGDQKKTTHMAVIPEMISSEQPRIKLLNEG